ncbi:MAG TPA: class I SAM-dependent methyltransferase [Opitutaceae bacterium]|jgi:SAM-dependent methyltransferase|nr:class I SAM-dependent methyltransferase [Opitutaceae bacterium]
MATFSERFLELPDDLVIKVNGSKDVQTFLGIGRCVVEVLELEIGQLWECPNILDFGCGLGRVLKPLSDRAPYSKLVGFDIDVAMLDACRFLLDDQKIRLVSSTASLPDASFDLVFAISVFTHLDTSIDLWLKEINRLIRPNGRALLTYHDETLFAEMVVAGQIADRALTDIALQERFIVGKGSEEGGAAMGTFLTTKAWEALVSPHFEVLVTTPRGLFGHQSYSLLRKPDAARKSSGDNTKSLITELREVKEREIRYRDKSVREYLDMRKINHVQATELIELRKKLTR